MTSMEIGPEDRRQPGLWTTPQAHDVEPGNPDRVRRFGTLHGGTNLTDDVTAWPTPNTASGGPNMKSTATHTGGMDLDGKVLVWGTPTSRDWKDGGSADTAPTNGLLGRQVIQNWPTPRSEERNQYNSQDDYVALSLKVKNWPTPDANAMNDGESRESWQARADKLKEKKINGNGAGMPLAIACQSLRQDPAQPNSGRNCWCGILNCDQPSHRRRLNPYFVEWLMGLPKNWTSKTARIDSAHLAMRFVRYRRLLHSLCSRKGRD